MKRWIKKREFAVYYTLYLVFNNSPFNIGEAIDCLSPFMSKRTALNIIKRLRKMGLIKHEKDLEYTVLDPHEALKMMALKYMLSRIKRRLKGKIEVMNITGSRIKLRILDESIRKIIEKSPLIDAI